MEATKRCSNCKVYPFCNKCNSPQGKCENWEQKKER